MCNGIEALEWRTETNGTCQVKQPVNAVHACNVLHGDLQIRPSSHLNSDSSHFNERLLQWGSLCLARELLKVQQYSLSPHFNGRSPQWEGLDSNL